jgi:putative resolvase
MNLSEGATPQGIHRQTAYRWLREGTFLVPARKMDGIILVGDLDTPSPKTVINVRVSSGDQRASARRVQRALTAAGTSLSEVDDNAA